MAFDKNNPPGNTGISIGDNSIRDNNAGIETALTAEHDFATGLTQTGRHKFGIDTEANRNLISDWVNGSIFLANDVRTGKLVLQAYNSGAFEEVDVEPGGATPTLPRLDSQSDFISCQHATWDDVTPAPGSPDTLAVDLDLSPSKSATIIGNTIISNPTNEVAGKDTTVKLEVIMDVTGGHTITWGTKYFTPGGVTPNIATGANARTMLYLSKTRAGNYLVSTAADMLVIA